MSSQQCLALDSGDSFHGGLFGNLHCSIWRSELTGSPNVWPAGGRSSNADCHAEADIHNASVGKNSHEPYWKLDISEQPEKAEMTKLRPKAEEHSSFDRDLELLYQNSKEDKSPNESDVNRGANRAPGPSSRTWTVPALKPRRKKKARASGVAMYPISQSIKATIPKPRGQLLGRTREETALTRQLKACVRCRMQKNRVSYRADINESQLISAV